MWEIKIHYSNLEPGCNGTGWQKGDFWHAILSYDDGMIIVGGWSTDAKGYPYDKSGTAHGAIINAMHDLTYKAQCSFVKWAYEHHELTSFYWIHEDRFASCGRVFEICYDGHGTREISNDFKWMDFKDVPYDKVSMNRTHPSTKVHARAREMAKQNSYFEQREKDWEDSWIDGPQP